MSKAGQIVSLSPAAGVAGGEFVIEGSGFDTSDPSVFAVWVDDVRAPLVALNPRLLSFGMEIRGVRFESV